MSKRFLGLYFLLFQNSLENLTGLNHIMYVDRKRSINELN